MATTETVDIRPQPGPQEAFLSSTADITIYGGAAGSGKSYGLLLEPLRNIDNGNFGALVLRRTTPEITNVGGLWDESEGLYPLARGVSRVGNLDWIFPSGAKVKFDHLEHEKSKHKYQGSQIPLIEFDELTHFTEGQFWYMVSRNRSTCGVRPYIRATCNPDATSFVKQLVQWWIDPETGYAIPQRSGVVRWFIRHEGQLKWGATADEVKRQHPSLNPKSLTFISATLSDNPALTSKDPGYLANLQSLPRVERERLLSGNWNVRDDVDVEWPSKYFDDIWVDELPRAFEHCVIAIDPARGGKHGDYCPDVLVGWHGQHYYVWADVLRRSAEEAAYSAVQKALQYDTDLVYVEGNGGQYLLGNEVRRYSIDAGIPQLLVHTPDSFGKKEDRIRKLGPRLLMGQIRFLDCIGCRLLVEQLKDFPIGDHDDGPDALEMAVRALYSIAREKVIARGGDDE